MATTSGLALGFLNQFVVRGAGRWRETVVDGPQRHSLECLPRVQAELDGIGVAQTADPDALPDAIEIAVRASASALADPHRSAALSYLGFSPESREKSKTEREDLAARRLSRRGRWFRTPSPSLGGVAPREALLKMVADELARDSRDRPTDSWVTVPDLSHERNDFQVDPEDARIWATFPYDRVAFAMASAQRCVRILQSWVPDAQPFVVCMRRALEKGASVEVLILHPSCDAAMRRMTHLGIDDPEYAHYHAVKLIGDLRPLVSSAKPGAVVVKSYTADPLVQLYGTEERMWAGLFWPGRFSMQAPQVELAVGRSVLGRAFSDHFAELWCASPVLTMRNLKRRKP